ncbi:MAG: HAMP domain-containing histidine kinase [Muribaculaceae bacterium]|nr:HAMP domain-containing histidine kinase [Muribaculaceae bacterium]
MRHFRLKFMLLLCSIVVMSGMTAALVVSDRIAPAILSSLAAVILCLMLWNHVGRIKLMAWTFGRSLEENDTSARFDTASDDPVIQDTLASFNRCMVSFHKVTMDLETRKLYYDRILKIMTHEMGNAITPVLALCDDIRKHPDRYRGEQLTEAIELIDSLSHGINRFLKAYYTLTHIPEPQLVQVVASDFMSRVRRLINGEPQMRGIDMDVCRFMASESVTLNIDADLMGQVMVNLIRNALDSVASVDDPQVTVTISLSDGHPCIIVEDNGAGIDPAIRENLFQPFVTTKPEGSGVGLYVSRQIARRHGGDLRLFATPGRGATAVVELR